jgi:hypothetical protein
MTLSPIKTMKSRPYRTKESQEALSGIIIFYCSPYLECPIRYLILPTHSGVTVLHSIPVMQSRENITQLERSHYLLFDSINDQLLKLVPLFEALSIDSLLQSIGCTKSVLRFVVVSIEEIRTVIPCTSRQTFSMSSTASLMREDCTWEECLLIASYSFSMSRVSQ